MPNAFNFAASPFDCLTPVEQELVRRHVDIAYFREGETVLERGAAPAHLFILIKGHVNQIEDGEVVASYGRDDCFDGRGLVAGRLSSRFVASEEVLAYQLSRQAVQDLIAANATFGALLFADIGQKLGALAQRHDQHELQSLTLARVDQAYLRPAHVVDAATNIVDVVRIFQDQRTTNVLVNGLPDGPGIFTTTALQRAILDGRPLGGIPVGEFATTPLIAVRPSDQLGDAMALLLRQRVHRVAVMDEGGQVCGMLEALDLFSFLSNHSLLITVQIEQAQNLQALSEAAAQITRLIGLLHRGGTRVALMAKLVQPAQRPAVRARLADDRAGRAAGQQLPDRDGQRRARRTVAQDRPGQRPGAARRLGAARRPAGRSASGSRTRCAAFGYPECPGHIMLNNPAWRGTASEFSEHARQWLFNPGSDGLMNLAIFMDAHAVAGDAQPAEGGAGRAVPAGRPATMCWWRALRR